MVVVAVSASIVTISKIAIMVAVPMMIVFTPATVTVPVTEEEPLSVVTRRHPPCARIRRTCPISSVPSIVVAHRVPVAPYPNIAGPRTSRLNPNADRRRRADSHPDGKLSEDSACRQQHQYKQFGFHDSIPFLRLHEVKSTLLAARFAAQTANSN